MLGFLIGTACLLGLVSTARRGHFAHGVGFGCHHGGWGERRDFRRWSRGEGERGGFGFLHEAFRRLETTHGQEKVLRDVMSDLWARVREAKGTLKDARRGYAAALRQESFDEVALGEATAKLEQATEEIRKALIDALAKVHGVLDDRQRRILADFIEAGPGFRGGFGGPYRGHHDRAPWEV